MRTVRRDRERSEVDREMSDRGAGGVVVQPESWTLTQDFWFGGFRAGRGRQKEGAPSGWRLAGCAAVPTRPGFAGRVGFPRAI